MGGADRLIVTEYDDPRTLPSHPLSLGQEERRSLNHHPIAVPPVIQTFSDYLDSIATIDGVILSSDVLAILADHGIPASDYFGHDEPAATPAYALLQFLGY